MSRLQSLIDKTLTVSSITTTDVSAALSMDGVETLSVQVVADVNTPSAKTFDTGTMEVQTLTFPALAGATDGDYVVFYDASGAAWAIALDTTGAAAAEPTGAAWLAVAAANKDYVDISGGTDAASVAALAETAIDALTGLTDVVTTDDSAANGTMLLTQVVPGPTTNPVPKNADDSGAGSITGVQTTAGVATEVSPSGDALTVPSHGLPTGLKGQLTTTGTLPAGLSLATDYFVIAVDANTVQLAASLADALAGTEVDVTGYGATTSVNTFTPTAVAGANVRLQKSNSTKDQIDAGTAVWDDEGSATNITADADVWLEKDRPPFKWARVRFTLTAGSLSATSYVLAKGR